jgi:hypothetical protein
MNSNREAYLEKYDWCSDGSIEYVDELYADSSDEIYPFHESDDEDVSFFLLFFLLYCSVLIFLCLFFQCRMKTPKL